MLGTSPVSFCYVLSLQRAKLSEEAKVLFDKVRAFPREALCRAQSDSEVTRAAAPRQERLFRKLAAKADELRLDITVELLGKGEAKALLCELKQLVGYLAELRQMSYQLTDPQCASVRSAGMLCLGTHSWPQHRMC